MGTEFLLLMFLKVLEVCDWKKRKGGLTMCRHSEVEGWSLYQSSDWSRGGVGGGGGQESVKTRCGQV